MVETRTRKFASEIYWPLISDGLDLWMIDRDVARHTKTGKNFFPTFLLLESLQYILLEKKVWGQIFDENSRVFGAFYMEYMYLETRKTYWDLYFRQIFSTDVWNFCSVLKKNFHWILSTNTNFVFFNDCLVQTCAYVFCGKQSIGWKQFWEFILIFFTPFSGQNLLAMFIWG